VLWLHNHYQVWGGESAAAGREADLLRAAGVEVHQEEVHNGEIDTMGALERLALPLRNAWSRSSYQQIRELCRTFHPDVAHAHNVWPLLSPAVFAAARAEGVPAVFTAHNYHLFCLNGVFFRDGRTCTDCFGRIPWAGVWHRCYRGVSGSLTRLAGLGLHRMLRTFHRVDRILTPTHFARERFLEAGFRQKQVQAKWLSCEDPRKAGGTGPFLPPPSDPTFLIACRLVPEKGVRVAVEAAAKARERWRLEIAGDGPERPDLAARAAAMGAGGLVDFLGYVKPLDLRARMVRARAVLLPSLWFETFGLTAIEAFASGRPVLASDLGALREVVDDTSGIRLPPGDAGAWAAALDRLAADPEAAERLGSGARARYDRFFTPERDAQRLVAIYRDVISEHQAFTRRGRRAADPLLPGHPTLGTGNSASSPGVIQFL
jgi:glycosyltransferase involved in cell wall biosynthesis